LRASSLSHDKIVTLLNQCFVPVYARNADYQETAKTSSTVPPEERAEYLRIFREAHQAKLSVGTVHVYILSPAGHPIDSLHVALATKPARLLEMMERAVKSFKVAAGEPLIKPCCQSKAPKSEPGSLVLHLTARYLTRQGSEDVRVQPVLGTERSSQWAYLPSENWVVMPREQWLKLLPAGEARPGTSWVPDREVAAQLLTHFYPPTENTDVRKNHIDEQHLKATVVSVRGGIVRAEVRGRLKMKHPFYHKDTSESVTATMVGYMSFDARRSQAPTFRLITEEATYGPGSGTRHRFGVAVRSLP
jgi:hypothetical protein